MAENELTPEQRERKRESDRRYRRNHKRVRILTPEQKEQSRERVRKWRAANAQRNAETIRNWRVANAERIRELKRAAYLKNQHAIKARAREWHLANPEKAAEKNQKWQIANREKENVRKREWRLANPDKMAQSARNWRKANPDACGALRRNAYARRQAADGSHTFEDVQRIYETQAGACAACQKRLGAPGKGTYHVDHIMPISRGGSNDPGNLQILCPRCNQSKNAMDPYEWANRRGLLFP
jgi:5-methylcytosine-specific restriction endonuclease McrA